MLSNVFSLYHKNIIVFGDFNYPDINWELKSLAGISVSSALFLDTIIDLFLNKLAEMSPWPKKYPIRLSTY